MLESTGFLSICVHLRYHDVNHTALVNYSTHNKGLTAKREFKRYRCWLLFFCLLIFFLGGGGGGGGVWGGGGKGGGGGVFLG